MPKIGIEEIKAAYSLATKVARGKLTDAEAAAQLNEDYGMNYSSAWAYLRKRRQLLAGERYTRTMNIQATKYFLEQIYNDEGEIGLRNALKSVKMHAAYYEQQGKSALPTISALVKKFEKLLSSARSIDDRLDWDMKVLQSYRLSVEKRKKKLPPKGHKPSKGTVTTEQFVRNPDVVAARLHHASGICDDCKEPAPFIRKSNGLPFLEVHHIVTLANGGDDTFENTVALCPNCHRRRHFG